MPNYLVERYLPVARAAELESAVRALRSAGDVTHVRATFVPEDETCFHVLEAPSREVVQAALERVALTYERIVEAVEQHDKKGAER